MRPIRRNESPITTDFAQYQEAKAELISRLGSYCSYCERPIKTLLAVEHIEPKGGEYGKPTLETVWNNFLLACVNCNSTKGSQQLILSDVLLPDRDNTFLAFDYTNDGMVTTSNAINTIQKRQAKKLLALTGLDKRHSKVVDSNDQIVAIDRVSQRMEAIATAQIALELLIKQPKSQNMHKAIEMMALGVGFFSIWMMVFSDYPQMKRRFIEAFKGTAASGCFDMTTAEAITPAPNPDELNWGGKV